MRNEQLYKTICNTAAEPLHLPKKKEINRNSATFHFVGEKRTMGGKKAGKLRVTLPYQFVKRSPQDGGGGCAATWRLPAGFN